MGICQFSSNKVVQKSADHKLWDNIQITDTLGNNLFIKSMAEDTKMIIIFNVPADATMNKKM